VSPLEIVNRRMQAFNEHNLEDFLALYAESIEIYTYPDVLVGRGKDHLRSLFEPMFNQKFVHADIHHQIAKDSFVISHETVSYEDGDTEYVSIWKVSNGLIQNVRFVRD